MWESPGLPLGGTDRISIAQQLPLALKPAEPHQLSGLGSALRVEHKPPRCERRLRSKALRHPVWDAHKTDPQGSDLLPQQRLGRAINSPAKRGAANLSGASCPRGQALREPCGDGRLGRSAAWPGELARSGWAGQDCVTCPGMALSPPCLYNLSAGHCSVHSSSLAFLLLTSLLKQELRSGPIKEQ